jgi:hypothetical protein
VNKIELAEFLRDRDEALRSLDEAKIRAYAKKYDCEAEMPSHPLVFWAAVHKARLQLLLTAEERRVSEQWLAENKFGLSAGVSEHGESD